MIDRAAALALVTHMLCWSCAMCFSAAASSVQDPTLDVLDGRAGIALVPGPIERLGHQAELDDEVGGQVLGVGLAALFPPEAEQGGHVVTPDDPSIGAAPQ